MSKHYYRGKDIDTMTKQELKEALIEMGEIREQEIDGQIQQLDKIKRILNG